MYLYIYYVGLNLHTGMILYYTCTCTILYYTCTLEQAHTCTLPVYCYGDLHGEIVTEVCVLTGGPSSAFS